MKLWIARNDEGTLELHYKKPYMSKITGRPVWVSGDFVGDLYDDLFPEVTFENSPQEIELKLSNHTSKPLTRDYFAKNNWEIVTHKPDENGFVLWEARWVRSMDEGSPYYSNISVTNMMYEDRFCISGKTGEGNVGYLMAYTEEDLINILKVFAIYDFYEQESKKS